MEIDRYLHVRCVNERCPDPADAHVPVAEVAPRVVAWPASLRCKTCAHPVMEIHDAAKQG